MSRGLVVPVLLLSLFIWSCDTDRQEPVRVFAASSLLEPLEKAVAQYHDAYPGAGEISLTFAGSQELAAQIVEGAPADIFLSADERQMDRVQEAGLLQSGEIAALFGNELLLVVRKEVLTAEALSKGAPHGGSCSRDAQDLLGRSSLRFLLADPLVPLGANTREYLRLAVQREMITEADRERLLRQALSFEASARAVAVKLSMGAGDAAFLYRSDALGLDRDEFASLGLTDAPKARYLGAVLGTTEKDTDASRFFGYLKLSEHGGGPFAEYGMDVNVE